MTPMQQIEQALESLHNHYDCLDLPQTAEEIRELLADLRTGRIKVLDWRQGGPPVMITHPAQPVIVATVCPRCKAYRSGI